jgi:hypothetical protein
MLNRYNMNKQDIVQFIEMIKDNPSLLPEEIQNIQIPNENTPQPLGLSTTLIECLVTAIVIGIVAAFVTLIALFFTLRIFTCLNINNCADDIAQAIVDNMSQGLSEA